MIKKLNSMTTRKASRLDRRREVANVWKYLYKLNIIDIDPVCINKLDGLREQLLGKSLEPNKPAIKTHRGGHCELILHEASRNFQRVRGLE